jgi:hypothetical protein
MEKRRLRKLFEQKLKGKKKKNSYHLPPIGLQLKGRILLVVVQKVMVYHNLEFSFVQVKCHNHTILPQHQGLPLHSVTVK